ncbi:hypothetical protein BJY52DRAFT_1122212, partial [Lactarius psammicola]
ILPGTEEILVQYLSGYLVDDASKGEANILQVVPYILGVPLWTSQMFSSNSWLRSHSPYSYRIS